MTDHIPGTRAATASATATATDPVAAGPADGPVRAWVGRPAEQQPDWRDHPAYARTRRALAAAAPLVTPAELDALRGSLAEVAAGQAYLLQLGDCAESLYECSPWHTQGKLAVVDRLADQTTAATGLAVVRVGRIGGQFAKPRSKPTEAQVDGEIPVFRGHLVNSEVPTRAARRHDPRRMLWAYEASANVTRWVKAHRQVYGGMGPWTSHEALVVDYEDALVREDAETGTAYLGSTHLPWIGDRTRQPDAAHTRLLAAVANPVACKIGPDARPDDVTELCRLLDPDRVPGRLTLIVRMGRSAVADTLPPLVEAVRRAGHPVVWLSDPMHGNTVRAAVGLKTRRLDDMVAEAVRVRQVLESQGQHAGGLHLEVAAADVTECTGGAVDDDEALLERYTTLCDPRLNPDQAAELVDAWLRGTV
ncbi:3-deoxy-7-phosphoheptulonate synthase [Streptomyces sp. NPDC047928]|uniref:3-deoxy-7-phosphoheptulonate synthase n=1 Tax=unclassified Streptomyces TaxID=2593676 RepID=UPI00371B22E9